MLKELIKKIKTKRESVKEQPPKMDKEHRAVLIVLCVIFMLYALSLMFPFVWMFFNSVKDKVDFRYRPTEFPTQWMFSNYLVIFEEFNLVEMLGNSLILCLAIPTVSAISTSCLAYALSRFKFCGRSFFFYLAISTMFISIEGGLASQYKLMFDLGLIDTHFGVILKAASGVGFNFLLMHSIFSGISETYSEAAEIDGASNIRVFMQIIVPQAISVIIAIWILSFIGVWNDFSTPYLYLQSYPTISLGLKNISDEVKISGDYPKMFATILVTSLPMIILFLIFQKKIMQLTLGGGLKG